MYLLVAASVALPMFYPLDLPIVPGKNTRSLFEYIEKIPAGTRMLLSFDYDPGSGPELQPAAVAILVHLFRRDLKPICVTNWVVGSEMAENALASAVSIVRGIPEKKLHLEKGRDYVNLGYKPGSVINIRRMSIDFLGPFPTDREGAPTASLEIFKNSLGKPFSMQDIGMIIGFTAGNKGIEDYIALAGEHKRPMGAACASVYLPRFYTYLQTRQLVGLAGGMPGAAEYEKLMGFCGPARLGMGPQSLCHLAIMGLIILGNLLWWLDKRKAGAVAEEGKKSC